MEDGRDGAGKWNKAGMNDLAGRLHEKNARTPFSLFMQRNLHHYCRF